MMAKRKKKTITKNRISKRVRLIVESSFVKGLMKFLGVLYILLMLTALALIVLVSLVYILSLLNWSKLNLQFYSTVLEFVKVLAWPIVVVVGVLAFSGEIKKLMERVTELEFKGAAAKLVPAANLQEPPEASDADFLQSEVNDETIQRQGESEDEYYDRIYRMPQAQLAFERIYRTIFGTQLELLQMTVNNPAAGITTMMAQRHYKKFLDLIGDTTYTFEEYMNYMISQGLLEYDDNSNSYRIEVAGKLFLRYLLEQGISDSSRKSY